MSAASPVGRLAAAHWPLLAVCALFLLAAALTLDDYGAWVDTWAQHAIGEAALDSLAGDGERGFEHLYSPWDRYFGAAFEAPLVLVQRIIGLDGGRDVYLVRHLLTHLFFLTGGVFCYLLVLRLFHNRLLALVATVLFLLHPRLYVHSFYNSKDIPFLAAFMIALYLVHRAFRRDTLGAFLLCGAGVGLLVNLRIMGIVLFAAVLALRALDLAFAGSAGERRRALLTGGAFALTATLTYYGSLPVLWSDPGRFADLIRTLNARPVHIWSLFRGEWLYSADGLPWDYVPVWVGITTPPATLLLALAGAVALAWRALRRPRHVLRDGPLRFGFLLAALPVATVAATVILESNFHNHWRHLYFLYAPLVLLAATGIHWLASLRGRWPQTGAYALTGVAVATVLVSMFRIHPHGDSYFTFLTDRTTPGHPVARYEMHLRQFRSEIVLADILGAQPPGFLFMPQPHRISDKAFSPDERERFVMTRDFRSGERNFLEIPDSLCPSASAPPLAIIHAERIYATMLYCMIEPVAWYGALRREALTAEPLIRSVYDVWRDGRLLIYVRDGCPPDYVAEGGPRLFLHMVPVDKGDLPRYRREYGFDNSYNALQDSRARIDGNCVAAVLLPDYPITSIRTGQFTAEGVLWEAEAAFAESAPDYAAARREALASEPVARSVYDVHLAGRTLTYLRDGCTEAEAETRFFLHVVPADEDDLSPVRKEYGFDNLDFTLAARGARIDGNCVAVARLPAYPIANIRTGQFTDGDTSWSVRFAVTPLEIEPGALAGEPLVRSVFNVHQHGDALIYVRDGCTDEDAETAFFLHVDPVDPGDLPDDRGQYGFDNLDFFLWERGARTGDRCTAVVPLPDYPIATIRTGQYDDTGALWQEEFALPDGE